MADANVLIAAFLRDSTVRRIITLSEARLYVPEYIFDELAKHIDELRTRAGLTEAAAGELLERLSKYLDVIPSEDVVAWVPDAEDAMAAVDPRDAPYLAAALALDCDGLWSDDPHLHEQDLVPVWTTERVVARLRGEGFRF